MQFSEVHEKRMYIKNIKMQKKTCNKQIKDKREKEYRTIWDYEAIICLDEIALQMRIIDV